MIEVWKLKCIIIDVCDTLVNFQTANFFVKYVIMNTKSRRKKISFYGKSFLYNLKVFRKFAKILKYSLKHSLLYSMQGLTVDELELLGKRFFEEILMRHLNLKVLKFINRYSNATIIIVSGAYDVYLKHLAKFIGASYYVCSELEFADGVFTGKIKGLDCMGINKVIKLSEAGLLEKIPFEHTAVLSDSISDMPLFSLGKYKIAVNPDKELKKLVGKGWYSIEEVV